jgi:Ca2+-binding EF-hand superfamily protein
MILVLTATVTSALSAPCQVHAGKPEAKQEKISPPFKFYDTDDDGYVSTEEAASQKMPAKTFESLDVDRDGRLNKDEFGEAPPMRLKEENTR